MMRQSTNHPEYQLFTDGACIGNPGPGGWAAILRNSATGEESTITGGDTQTTNNRMELLAVIEGLRAIDHAGAKITIVGDSEYVLKGISTWLPGWKKRGWRKADKKPVLNADLWKALDALLARHHVTVEWTRGHTGHKENEECDRLAGLKAKEYAP